MAIEFVLCDVFAERVFAGNPLAVFFDIGDLGSDAMHGLAREFGWSEITFVVPQADKHPPRVRIWTPRGELPFAGHPTVGTAVALAATGRIAPGLSVLELGIGPVAVDVELEEPARGRATMTQRRPEFGPVLDQRARLAEALGIAEEDLAPDLPAQTVSTGLTHLMVPVRSLSVLGRATPVPGLFEAALAGTGCEQAYLFSVDTPGSAAAARARLLAPAVEDPATGSAAGPLGAYLVRYGLHRAGVIDIEQGVEMGRPSRIRVNVPQESGEIGSVQVSGTVHLWARGTLDASGASSMLEP